MTVLMETILVTGGAGFIGSSLAESLLAQGRRVVALDDLSDGRLDAIDHLLHNRNFTFVRGSVLDRGLLTSVVKGHQVCAICHQAAVAGVGRSLLDPVRSIEANITGTANVFDVAAETLCRRVVFASSWAVYGDSPSAVRREEMIPDPRSPYAVSKAAQEMLARTFCDLHSLEIVGLRYFTVYGRGQNPASGSVIPAFILKALRNDPIAVHGDGLQSRDFVHVDDVVRANLLALSVKDASGTCYNIGSGTATTILELARTIVRCAGSSSQITTGRPRPGDVRSAVADISRARQSLRFAPAVGLEQGLTQTIAWYRRQMPAKQAA